MITSLTEHLATSRVPIREGHLGQCPLQAERLSMLIRAYHSRRIAEIGFNAGHSSEFFLTQHPDISVTSFDFGHHPCVTVGKEFIDRTHPDRHTLIVGNSVQTLPAYRDTFSTSTFDLLFVDGGHHYSTARKDLENGRELVRHDSLVVMDDVVESEPRSYNLGPTRAWNEMVAEGIIHEIGREEYGRAEGRGMAWGRFVV